MARLLRALAGFHPATAADANELKEVGLGDELVCFPVGKIDDKARSIAQNQLYWRWLTAMQNTQAEQHKGTLKEDWHVLMKEKYLCKIFERDDQSYAELMQTLRELYKHDQQQAMKLRNGVLDLTSTTQASVKQFSELLTCMDRFCGSEGIQLPAEPGLEEMARVERN